MAERMDTFTERMEKLVRKVSKNYLHLHEMMDKSTEKYDAMKKDIKHLKEIVEKK